METKSYLFIVRARCKEIELGDVVSLFTKKRDAVLKVEVNGSELPIQFEEFCCHGIGRLILDMKDCCWIRGNR